MALTKATYSMIQGSPASVLDYGADPTGAADSTAAFNSAIAANSQVYVPAGTYSINSTLTIGADKHIFGEGVSSVLSMDTNVSLINTTNAFRLNDICVLLPGPQPSAHTATVIKLDGNTGGSYQLNNIDLSGLTILGNDADCVAIHFKMTNSSSMLYNNMHDIAVVAEGVKQACILFEVDNSSSFIQGNTFSNLNLIHGGIRYIYNGTPDDSTLMIGNYFDGTNQTGSDAGEIFELAGINNGYLWDASGYANISWHKNSAGVNGGVSFYELRGPDQWASLQPDIFVHDGWGENVQKYRVISPGVTGTTLNDPKAMRGKMEILDPCINKLDQRINVTGMSQAGEIITVGSVNRSAVLLTNTVDTTNTAQIIVPYSACTLSKFPEFKIAFRKEINGYYGAGTPTTWNPRLDAKVGLISDAGNDGVYMKLVGVGGSTNVSTISLCYLVSSSETVLDNSLTLSQDETCYLSVYTDDDNVYLKATTIISSNMSGALISENPSIGSTTGWVSVARSSLFNANTMTLNPQFTLTSTDKEIGRAKYHVFGIEYISTEM